MGFWFAAAPIARFGDAWLFRRDFARMRAKYERIEELRSWWLVGTRAHPHIPSMTDNDTSTAAQQAVDRRYASMSFAEKAERLRAVTRAANQMALAGLRLRHPAAGEGELLLRLARLRLGDDLVKRVYGDGSDE